MTEVSDAQIKEAVRRHYADRVQTQASCCGSGAASSCCGGSSAPNATLHALGYTEQELAALPEGMTQTAFGCGNPLAFAGMRAGDVVLDLGSGAGMDVILAAQRVGPGGKAIGLDMTPEMIEKARANADLAGVGAIAEFRLGEMEDMPVADASVDWIISNCVINLSPDKEQVFREAFRVLRPGGRLLVSDIVASNLPPAVRADLTAWAECVAGAIDEDRYLDIVRAAGFEDVQVVERADFTEPYLGQAADAPPDPAHQVTVSSVRVSAVKPRA
ncbi:MAG: arsenite methyltransferase [Anaerolineae bacterium]